MSSSDEETKRERKPKRPPLVPEIIRLQKKLSAWLSHRDKPERVLQRGRLIHLIVDLVCPPPKAKDGSESICCASVNMLDESIKAVAFQHLTTHCNNLLRIFLMRRKCDCTAVEFAFDDELTRSAFDNKLTKSALVPFAHMLKIKAISDYPFNELFDYLSPTPAADEDVSAHLCVRLTYMTAVLMRLLLSATNKTKSQIAKIITEDRDTTTLLLKVGNKLLNSDLHLLCPFLLLHWILAHCITTMIEEADPTCISEWSEVVTTIISQHAIEHGDTEYCHDIPQVKYLVLLMYLHNLYNCLKSNYYCVLHHDTYKTLIKYTENQCTTVRVMAKAVLSKLVPGLCLSISLSSGEANALASYLVMQFTLLNSDESALDMVYEFLLTNENYKILCSAVKEMMENPTDAETENVETETENEDTETETENAETENAVAKLVWVIVTNDAITSNTTESVVRSLVSVKCNEVGLQAIIQDLQQVIASHDLPAIRRLIHILINLATDPQNCLILSNQGALDALEGIMEIGGMEEQLAAKAISLLMGTNPLHDINTPTDHKRALVCPPGSGVVDLSQTLLHSFASGLSESTILEFLLDMTKYSSSTLRNHLIHYLQHKPELLFSRYAAWRYSSSSFLLLMVHLAHSSEQLCRLIAKHSFTNLIQLLRSSSRDDSKLKNTLQLILCCMMGDNHQPASCQSWAQETDESISQMLWTQQTICSLIESTVSGSHCVAVLSKLILSFLTVVLTDEQICSHCCNSEEDLAVSLILSKEEVSTLAEHLKLCCYYPNVAVNCISPSAFLRALCNLNDSSAVCCSCAQALLLQTNANSDSKLAFHIERALKTFVDFGTTKMRTAAFNLLWNLVEMKFEIGTKTKKYIIFHAFPHKSEELADYILQMILDCTHETSPEAMTEFATLCYEYHKYQKCIKLCDEIKEKTKVDNKCNKTANLLKGKACFYSYQRHIWNIIALQRKGMLPYDSEKADNFKKMTKETIDLLGNALDNSYIDEEGKQLLDLAMMDYVREVNGLNDCRRCILCLEKTKDNLKASHIIPKTILQRLIADDMGSIPNDKKAFLVFRNRNCNPKQIVQSAGEITYKLLCHKCEQILSSEGEEQFASVFTKLYADGCRYGRLYSQCISQPPADSPELYSVIQPLPITYGPWLFHFCVGMIFRGLCFLRIPQFSNDKEVYRIFQHCRAYLLRLKASQRREKQRPSDAWELCIIPSSVAKTSSSLRGAFISAANMRLDEDTPDPCNNMHFILIHLGNVSIVLKLQPAKNVTLPAYIHVSPNAGMFELPILSECLPIPKGIIATFLQIKQMEIDSFQEAKSSLRELVPVNHLPSLLAIIINTKPNERTKLCTKLIHAEHGTFQCLHLPVICFHFLPSFNSGKGGVLYRVHLLPREYKIDRLGAQGSIKRVQLPQGHKVLVHIPAKTANYSATYIIAADIHKLHKSNYTAGVYAVCVHFQNRSSEIAFGVNLLLTEYGHLEVKEFMHKKAEELLQLSAIQDIFDHFTLNQDSLQCSNFKTYIQRLKYSRQLPCILKTFDRRCSKKGCWYCQDLCACCMEPSKVKLTNGNNVKFCSRECKKLLTNKPSEIEVFAQSTESDMTLLHVTGVVTLKDVDSIYQSSASYTSSRLVAKSLDLTLDDESNTIVSMLVCNGNQSEIQRPFALCALRTVSACRLVDFFVNSSFISLDGFSYMGDLYDDNMVDFFRETRLIQKVIQKLEDKAVFSFIRDNDNSNSDSYQWNIEAIDNKLPSNFRVRCPKSGTEFNCIQLPKQHQLLLHSTDNVISGELRVFLLCFGESYCDQPQEYPYVVSMRIEFSKYAFTKDNIGYGRILTDGVIISDDGKNEALSTLVERSGPQEHEQVLYVHMVSIERGQQMVDSVLPGMFKQAGCRNVKALIYRAMCERFFDNIPVIPLADQKCADGVGCWYCKHLCNTCLKPITLVPCYSNRHGHVYCSYKCIELWQLPMSPVLEKAKYNGTVMLRVTTVASTENAVIVIYLCADKTEQPYVLCQVRAPTWQEFLDYFIDDKFTAVKPLWDECDDRREQSLIDINNYLRNVLQPAVESTYQTRNPKELIKMLKPNDDNLLSSFRQHDYITESCVLDCLKPRASIHICNPQSRKEVYFLSARNPPPSQTFCKYGYSIWFTKFILRDPNPSYWPFSPSFLHYLKLCTVYEATKIYQEVAKSTENEVQLVMISEVDADMRVICAHHLHSSGLELIPVDSVQPEIDEIWSLMKKSRGINSIHSLILRERYVRELTSSKRLASIDQRCYPDVCWYCSNLCECCMQPILKQLAKEQNFCSLHCKNLCTQQDTTKLPVIAGYVHRSITVPGDKIGTLPSYAIAHIMKAFDTTEGENKVIQVSLCIGNGFDEIPLNKMFVLYHQRTLTKQLLSEFFISANYELIPFQSNTEMDEIIRDNHIKLVLKPLLSRFGFSNVYQFAAHTLKSLSAHIINLLPDTGIRVHIQHILFAIGATLQTTSAVPQTDGHRVLLHWTISQHEEQRSSTYFLMAATDHLYLLFIECIQAIQLQIVDGVTVLPDDEVKAGLKCTNFLSPGRKHYTTLSQVQDDLMEAVCNTEILERRGLSSILPLFHRIQYDRSSNIPYDINCGKADCYCKYTCHGCMSLTKMCVCEELKRDSQKEKEISNDLKNLGLLVSRAIYKNGAIFTVHLCIGNGSSRFSLDEPLILYHKRPLNRKDKQVFAEFNSTDIPAEYLSDIREILIGTPSPSEISTPVSITKVAKKKCQGEFLSLLPEEFQTKKPRRCLPSKCLKLPDGHHVLFHFGKRRSSATVTTCIVAARYTEDCALSNTPFYMIMLHFNQEFNVLAADGFYFEVASTFQTKDCLNPTIPFYHHLFTNSEAHEIIQYDLPEKMEENGVCSLSTLLHRANQISLCSEAQMSLYCAEKTALNEDGSSPYRSSPTFGITASKILFSEETKCPQGIERCWYCQDCCQCCFKPVSYNAVYCSEACYKSLSMATEHAGMIMVNIPQDRIKVKGKKKSESSGGHRKVLFQVAEIERLSDSNPDQVRICDILWCVGEYDTPYILFHQWDPEQQHFADFFISETYEPLEPVWKFEFSPLPLINKLKESGYIRNLMMAAIALCREKQPCFMRSGCDLISTKVLLPFPDLLDLGIKLPIEEKICLPKGFKAHSPDSSEKCLCFPNDHQLLFHNYCKREKGGQVILTFLITDPNETLYFIVLDYIPLHCSFCASCYYVTHDNKSLTVVRTYIGNRRGGENPRAMKIAQSELKIFPNIIRERGWPSLHALLTRIKLLRTIPSDACTRILSLSHSKCLRSDCPYCKDFSDVNIAVASDTLAHEDTLSHVECNCLSQCHGDPESQTHVFKGGKLNDTGSPTLILHIVTTMKQSHHQSSELKDVTASILLCLGDGSDGYPLGELLVLCTFDVISGKPHVIADYFLTDAMELQRPLWYQEKLDEQAPALQLISNLNLKETIDRSLKQAGVSELNHLIQSAVAPDGHVNLLPHTFQVSKRPIENTRDFIKFPEGHMPLLHYTEFDGHIETTYFLCIDSRNQLYLIVIEYASSTKCQLQLSDGIFVNLDLTVSSFINKDSRHKWSIQHANKVASDVIPKILKNQSCRNIQGLSKFGKSQRTSSFDKMSVDLKCRPPCWYCEALCQQCMKAPVDKDLEIYCSKDCKNLTLLYSYPPVFYIVAQANRATVAIELPNNFVISNFGFHSGYCLIQIPQNHQCLLHVNGSNGRTFILVAAPSQTEELYVITITLLQAGQGAETQEKDTDTYVQKQTFEAISVTRQIDKLEVGECLIKPHHIDISTKEELQYELNEHLLEEVYRRGFESLESLLQWAKQRRENLPAPSPDTWCCIDGCQYCRYMCPCCMRLALNKVEISQALKCCWHCQNTLRDERLPTSSVYNYNHHKKIQGLIAKGKLPESTVLKGWIKWSPDILQPTQYEHTLPTTVQYLPVMQVVAVERLESIGRNAKNSIISAEVYAKVSDDETLMLEAYMWSIIQFSDFQQYSTECVFDRSLNQLQLIPSTNPLQSSSQCTDSEAYSLQGDKITKEVFEKVVKPALLQQGYLAMRELFDSSIPDGPIRLLRSSLPDYFSFLPEHFVISRPTEVLVKSPLENIQLPEHYHIVLHMTDVSFSCTGACDSQITYFLVIKIEKGDVTFFLTFIDYRKYKELQLTPGRLNCSLQFVDGVEIEEIEGKPKVIKFMSDFHINHPNPLIKVQAMVEEAVSRMMQSKGYSSFRSLLTLMNVSRIQIVNKKEGTLSPDTRCSTNGCWYCSSLCKFCMNATDSELCNKCHEIYIPTSSKLKQQPILEHLNLNVSVLHEKEKLHAQLHAFHVDELESRELKERAAMSLYKDELESHELKERAAMSLYKCTHHHLTEVYYVVCLLKTPQWQRVRIVKRLASGKCELTEESDDENDPHIAEQLIRKVELWVQSPPTL